MEEMFIASLYLASLAYTDTTVRLNFSVGEVLLCYSLPPNLNKLRLLHVKFVIILMSDLLCSFNSYSQ